MYDAIVIGARCAGSPTAMLLARRGYRVLLVDRASFPSDTISTHAIWPHGGEILERWGLWDRLVAAGCPVIGLNLVFDIGPFALKGGARQPNDGRGGLCPRRTVLDTVLVHAAVESGADLRENFTVESITWDGNMVTGIRGHGRAGGSMEERAQIVIGADGVHSLVAKAVEAKEYDSVPALATFFYSYFSGIEIDDVEQYIGLPNQGAAYFPTNDGLTLVASVWQSQRFHEIRTDIEGRVLGAHRQIPQLAERLAGAKREEKWYGIAGVPNFFRRPFGPGWALVGDAGYCKDPLTGQGITDAFMDAEALTEALDAGFAGRRPLQEALEEYETARNDRVKAMYHFTCDLARLEPPPPEMVELFKALRRNQSASDQFFSAITGALPLPAFFAPDNVARIMAEPGAKV